MSRDSDVLRSIVARMTQAVPTPVVSRGGGSSGGGPGRGTGGGGGSDDESRLIAQAIARLNRQNIGADEAFLRQLSSFLSDGIARAQREGEDISAGRFQRQWDQVITTMIAYSDENRIRQLSAGAFDGLRERLCSGFWPFC